jgi:hypothetical protein
MSTKKLSNIPYRIIHKFLIAQGLVVLHPKKGRGGHVTYSRDNLLRPIVIQNHIDPVPEFIVKQILRHLNMSKEAFFEAIERL